MGAGLDCPNTVHPVDEDLSPGVPGILARSVQFVRRQRFSRLCVLMNPCPAGLEIHPDLAGYGVIPSL